MRQEHSRREALGWLAALGAGAAIAAAPVRPTGTRTRIRTYYIGADPVLWNYVPQGRNLITGAPFTAAEQMFTQPGLDRLGPVYEKSVYREYTDETFTTPTYRPARDGYMGLLGPVIRAQVGDTIRVVFRNNTPFPASVHPHGVFYKEDDEGALYDHGRADSPGDSVAPGHTYTYTWQVPDRAGPGPGDPSSVGWLYHDHSTDMGIAGTQAGMVGPIVVTRRGAAREDGSPRDVDREVFALFTQFDENESPYLSDNIARAAPGQAIDRSDLAFQASNIKASINGYLFGNGPLGTTDTRPALTLARGERARWYVLSIGDFRDAHAAHWHGNTVVLHGTRTDVVDVLPATSLTADMRPDDPGIWLFHCHLDEHMRDGMVTRYRVDDAPHSGHVQRRCRPRTINPRPVRTLVK